MPYLSRQFVEQTELTRPCAKGIAKPRPLNLFVKQRSGRLEETVQYYKLDAMLLNEV